MEVQYHTMVSEWSTLGNTDQLRMLKEINARSAVLESIYHNERGVSTINAKEAVMRDYYQWESSSPLNHPQIGACSPRPDGCTENHNLPQ